MREDCVTGGSSEDSKALLEDSELSDSTDESSMDSLVSLDSIEVTVGTSEVSELERVSCSEMLKVLDSVDASLLFSPLETTLDEEEFPPQEASSMAIVMRSKPFLVFFIGWNLLILIALTLLGVSIAKRGNAFTCALL